MSYNYGLTGVSVVKLQSVVGTSGKPIRVFDVCLGTTAVVNASLALYAGVNTTGDMYISIDSATPFFNSNAGIRFPSGCFGRATGATSIVNYIEEL